MWVTASPRPARAGAPRLRGWRGGQSEVARRCQVGERTRSGRLKVAREEGRRAPAAGRRSAASARRWPGWSRSGTTRRSPSTPTGWPSAPGSGAAPRPGAEERALEAAEQDREDVAEARRAWRHDLAGIDPVRLILVDGTGIDTRMNPRLRPGRPRPAGARQGALGGRRERPTLIGALAPDGIVASRGVAAATGTAVFLAFVEQVLVPALRDRPDALVVMDNPAAPTRPRRSARPPTGRGWPTATCRPTRPTSTRSSRPGPSSRRGCGRSAPARGRPWSRPSARGRPLGSARSPVTASASGRSCRAGTGTRSPRPPEGGPRRRGRRARSPPPRRSRRRRPCRARGRRARPSAPGVPKRLARAAGAGHPGVDAAPVKGHEAPRLRPGRLGLPPGPREGDARPIPPRRPRRLLRAPGRASVTPGRARSCPPGRQPPRDAAGAGARPPRPRTASRSAHRGGTALLAAGSRTARTRP